MPHWHTHKTTNIKQTKETDGQADGERWKTDKSHGAGIHLFMEIHSVGSATEHQGVTPECSQLLSSDDCRDLMPERSCKSCSSAPALRGSIYTNRIMFWQSEAAWAVHPIPDACGLKRHVCYSGFLSSLLSSWSEEETLSSHPVPGSPELEKHHYPVN